MVMSPVGDMSVLIELMCSDLDSFAGTGVEVHGTSDRILSCQSCVCCIITATGDGAICDDAVQPAGTCRAELTTLIDNAFDRACEGAAGHTVQNNRAHGHFSVPALVACLAVDQAGEKLAVAG